MTSRPAVAARVNGESSLRSNMMRRRVVLGGYWSLKSFSFFTSCTDARVYSWFFSGAALEAQFSSDSLTSIVRVPEEKEPQGAAIDLTCSMFGNIYGRRIVAMG